MARPREFQRDDVLDKAMQVFWTQGYEATSLNDLTRAMGLSKSSFYDSFGSKHALFLATLDFYRERVTAQVGSVADLEAPARQVLTSILRRAVDRIVETEGRRGCFLNNTAVERGPFDPEAMARCRAGMTVMEDSFYRLVARSQEEGQVSRLLDPRATARYLTAMVNGIMVVGKANPDRKMLDDIVAVALEALT